jgi:uncharacterized protein YndB with AHSA1/START domain
MATLACEQTIAAPVAIVWTVLTDHRAFAAWGAAEKVTLERVGSPDANGVGAIRRIESGLVKVREEIVEFSPMRRLRYTVLSGPPVRDYFGDVVLTEAAGGTQVRWTIDFAPRIPGTAFVLKLAIGRVIAQMLAKAKVEAEKRAAA